jgi:hypothetical protein
MTCGGAVVLLGVDLCLHLSYAYSGLRKPTALLTPLIGIIILFQIYRFGLTAEAEQDPASRHYSRNFYANPIVRFISAIGYLFIIGAAMFDLSCTFLMSPDLRDEGNVYILAIAEPRVPLWKTYAYVGCSQVIFISLFCAFWQAFLRHLPSLLLSIRVYAPESIWDFIRVATGGGHLSWRQWLFPLKHQELPLRYHYLWLCSTGVIFGISLFRIYAGLEWLNCFEISTASRLACILTGVFGSMLVYMYALRIVTQRDPVPYWQESVLQLIQAPDAEQLTLRE